MRERPPPPGPEPSDDELMEAVQVLLRRLLRSGGSAAPPASHAPDAWLPPAEAAAYAAVSEDTLRAWITRGQLPAGRVGKVIRVRRSNIDALLAGKEQRAAQHKQPRPDRLGSSGAPVRDLPGHSSGIHASPEATPSAVT